jgi:NAD(P)H-hydrate epimerase
MRPLGTCVESRNLDVATCKATGMDELFLMEKASLRLWDAVSEIIEGHVDSKAHVVAVAGKGNNGGDALAVLRHMWFSGYTRLSAIVSDGILSRSCKKQREFLETLGVELLPWDKNSLEGVKKALRDADLVLDGIIGIGIKVEAFGEAGDMIDIVNEYAKGAMKIAIDMPSGIGDFFKQGYRCIKADHTCVIEPEKIALYLPHARMNCGHIHLIQDVFPAKLIEKSFLKNRILEEKDMLRLGRSVAASAYKKSRGSVIVFAGAKGTAGAARLCTKAALAAGAGYCTLYIDEDCYDAVVPDMESIVIRALDPLKTPELDADVILIGPGWGEALERVNLLRNILQSGKPVILDASALRLIARHKMFEYMIPQTTAMTPHPGEFIGIAQGLRCSETGSFMECIGKIAHELQSVVVFKSHVTWIDSGLGHISVLDGMKPELGTAGSGDVLAGLFAGLCAQSLAIAKEKPANSDSDAFPSMQELLSRSAELAVLVHKSAGSRMAEEKGWFLAEDLIQGCSKILHDLSTTKN